VTGNGLDDDARAERGVVVELYYREPLHCNPVPTRRITLLGERYRRFVYDLT
jgi:hypothetical protein